MASKKRDKLVHTALLLFYRDGFHATGIDRILAESGVAKMTLYNHFPSKDDLIQAVLSYRDVEFRRSLHDFLETPARGPREKLLAVFDYLEQWFAKPGFCGCLFVKAAAEYAHTGNPIYDAVCRHKQLVTDEIAMLAHEAGVAEAEKLAGQLVLLMDGAIVQAQVCCGYEAAGRARDAARVLIDAALA